ncbi:MAG TPA: hypothetical protein VIK89_02395 [Cytophagaceae bacterium]
MRNIVIVLCCLLLCSSQTATLSTKKVADGIRVKLPKDFLVMSDDDIAAKYPSTKKPLAMFTNVDRMVDFGINVSKTVFPGNDLEILKGVYKATIMDTYTNVQFTKEEIQKIKNRDYIVFEYTGQFEKVKNYTYIQYTLINGQVFIFNFTCPASEKAKWAETAEAIMTSVKINESGLKLPQAPAYQNSSKGKNPQQVLEMQKAQKKQTSKKTK